MKFIVMYMAPAAGLEEWAKTPEAERKAAEEKMQAEWRAWMESHKSIFVETNSVGKTKRVTKGEVVDTKNDLMIYSIVEGDSPEAVAEHFKDHPHFGIPNSTIEIMPIRPIGSIGQ